MANIASRVNFKQGQRKLDAPVTGDDLKDAIAIFIDVIDQDPSFHRALGWHGYALVRQFTEGYKESEVIAEALVKAEEACAGSPDDYDNQWALAIAQLYNRDWATSDATYRLAIQLDIEGNIHLLSDYGVSLVYGGDSRNALRNTRKAKGFRDWHKWNTAWVYFFLGRPEFEADEDSNYFDLALEEIDSMHLPPGHRRYLSDAKLVAAAIHTLRNDDSAADEAMTIYRAGKPDGWSIDQEMARSPFNPAKAEAAANRDFWQMAAGRALGRSSS